MANPVARIAAGLRRRLLRWAGISSYRLDANHFVAEFAPMQLPLESPLRRDVPRAPEHRQHDYMEKFDATTLFYDVFWRDGELVLVGPPLVNLAPHVLPALQIDGKPAGPPLLRHDFERTDVTVFAAPTRPSRVDLDIVGAHLAARVMPEHTATFAGRRTLLTKSKDNDLVWIEDWIDFHVRAHGINAVLFYDNGSSRYTTKELLQRISAVPGVEAAVVVPWPYAFGPQGGGRDGSWDSNYCEYGVLEDARRRFLLEAAAVFQIDVDELIVTPGGGSVFDLLARSPTGALHFPGRWITPVSDDPTAAQRRHRQFAHYVDDGDVAAQKWIAVPARVPDTAQFMVHRFGKGFEPTTVDHPMLRHFRAISTSWKYRRSELEAFDPARHLRDDELLAEMQRIGWRD